MKLHLPTRLRSAVLACFVAVAGFSPTLASGVIGGAAVMFALSGQQAHAEQVAYSGTIYTFNGFKEGASDMAYGKYVETTQADDGSFTLTDTTVEDASGWTNVKKIISDATSPANTFRFTATNGTPGLLNYTFGPMNLGGVIVESGAVGWGISNASTGSTRTINLGNANDTAAFSTINEDFILDNSKGGSATVITVRGTQTWTIEQGKTFTLKTHSTQNISQSGSTTIQGGGSAVFSNKVASGGAISIAVDTTADMALGLIQSTGATLTNAGALTLGGTVKLVSAITNTGTVTLKSDTIFDLSGLTATEVAGQDKTYQYVLVSGGTINVVDAEGNAVTNWTLDANHITGVEALGKTWSFDANTGTITYVQTANSLIYSSGGNMVWNTSNTVWDGGAVFTEGDIVTFSTADANVTLESDIAASTVTIAEGCIVTLSGEHTLTVGGNLDIAGGLVIEKGTVIAAGDSVKMEDNATLELRGKVNGLGLISADATNTIILNGGNDTQFAMVDGLPYTLGGTWPNLAAAVEVKSGSLAATSSNQRYRAPITVLAGAGLQFVCGGGDVLNAELRLNGDGGFKSFDNNTARGALMVGDSKHAVSPTIAQTVRLQSDSSIEVYEGSSLVIGGALASDGHTLTKVGAGTLALGGNATSSLIEVTEGAFGLTGAGSTNNATINVAFGATMKYGTGDGDKSAARGTMADTTINIESGAELWLQHAAANNASAAINLNGGKLTIYDCAAVGAGGTAGEVSFGTLNITADSELMHGWKGMFTADTLMGSGNLTHVTAEGWDAENLVVKFGTVQDYTGTVNLTTDAHATVEVGVIDMAAGLSGTIVDSVISRSFHKIGEGSFTLGGLTASEQLHMNYEGALTLTNGLTVANGTILSYGTSPLDQVLSVNTLEEGATSLVLDLFAITDVNDLKDLNLGISTDISKDYLTVLGLADYSINEGADGFWHLAAAQLAESDWDKNWGGTTLAKAPTSLPEVNLTTADAYSGFASNLSEDGHQVAFQLTGTAEGVTPDVYGGSLTGSATVENGIWIDVIGGNYNAIVGGNRCNNWDSGDARALNADTHILMKGGTAGLVIGGNQQDGKSPVMTGDSYISIMEGANVTGAIIGSGVNHHTATTTQKGNTNIFVYAVLSDNSYSNSGLSQLGSVNGSIVGGSAFMANVTGTGVLEGDTNITIDLTDAAVAEGGATFAKRIVGGHSYGAGSCTATLKGSTHVTINGKDDVTFSAMVIGGSYMAGGASTISGSSHIAISGGIFSSAVIGGSYHSAANGTLTQGGSSIEISGGSFNDWVIGGHYNACDANVRSAQSMGTTSITLTGGTVANVLGGNYILNAAYPNSSTVESANIHISDTATVTGNVVGGAYVGGASGAWLENVSVGSVHILMDGGTANTIYGGSQVLRDAQGQKVVQGDISITLEGGTVGGNVYAAGCQQAGSHMETDSTIVNIGSGVALASGSTVSGGYFAAGTCTSTFTGEGDRTLAFTTENATYANTNGVSFKDFNKVFVAAGSSVEIGGIAAETSTIDMLTKTGAGSLVLNAATQTAVTVEEGTLAVKGTNTLTAVTVNSGAAIDGTADGAVLGGSLTLGGGAAVSLGNSGLALGGTDSVLTLGGVSSLVSSALADVTPDGGTVITLFDNVADVIGKDGASIKDALSSTSADGGIALSEYFTVAGYDSWAEDVKDAAKLVMDGTTLKLSFATMATPEWTWDGGASGIWTENGQGADTDWESTSGTTAGQDVYFSASGAGDDGSGTVTVSGNVTPFSIRIVSGKYTFVSDGTSSGSIKLQTSGDSEYQGQLLITGNATEVALNLANANLGGTTLLEGGTLILGNNDALGSATKTSLKFNGGSLVYADGITKDISSQISADSTATVKVDVAGNDVTWAAPDAALGKGIEKSGTGTLTLVGGGAAAKTTAVQTINAGTLALAGGNIELNGGVAGTGTLSVDASSGYIIGGDNSGFEGTILLGGASDQNVVFGTAASAGGANTTLELAGHKFYVNQSSGNVEIASKVVVSQDTVMDGFQSVSYTFSNTITGHGGLTIGFGQAGTPVITVTGDMSGYNGKLTLGTNAAMKPLFTVENAAGVNANATIAGYGTLKMGMEGDANIGATLTESVGLTGGNGLLTITGNKNTAKGVLTAGTGGVQLGTADVEANWAGNSLVGGKLTVVNGKLTGISDKAEGATLDVKAAANTTVYTGTTEGSLIDSITLTADGAKLDMDVDDLIVGGDGNPTLSVKLSVGNIGSSDPLATVALAAASTEGDAIILLNEGGTLTVNEADIDISNQSVIDLIVANKAGMKNSLLTLTNGTLAYGGTDAAYAGFGLNDKLSQYGLRVEGVSGGSIVLNGDTTGVYLVTDDPDATDPHEVNNAGTLGMYSAVVIDKNQTLNLNLNTSDTAAVNNLTGGADSKLVVTNTGDTELNIELNNYSVDNTGGDPASIGTETIMEGGVIATSGGSAADTNVTKTGEGTLIFSETGWLETDNLIIKQGGLEFQGGVANNHAYSVTMEDGKLTLSEGSGFVISKDDIHDGSLVANGGSITLDKGSVLDVSGNVELNDGFDSLSGEGTLKLGGTLTGADKLDGINMGLGSGSVVTVDGDGHIASVNGSGDLMAAGGKLTVDGKEDSFFSGSMIGGTAPGTLVIENGGGAFTYKAPANGGSHDWSLVNKAQDHATVFDLRGSDGANNTLTLGSLNLADNSGTIFMVHGDDLAKGGTFVDLTSLEVGDGANITINADGDSLISSGVIVLGNAGSLTTGDAYTVNLEGDSFAKLASTATLDVVDGQLVLRTTASDVNKLALVASSHNAKAGATLLWDSVAPAGGDLEKAFNAVYAQAAAGDTAAANRAMASVAGSSISAMGMAFSGDVDRQLRAIRNRTTTMGVDPCYVREGMPYFNAWVNAEGDYRKMDADGTAAGYTLSSWGGTLGFDVDVTPKFTMGLAVTAMYGDFDSDAPDQATGDFDTYYVSLFARYASHRWTHTFVGTMGRADASLKRTVDYGAGSYKTEGDTVGLGFGLMYEVGYVIPVSEESSTCFQPVFNIAWRHAGIDGYNESGSDAALHAGSQTVDVVTLGLGARVQSAVGENLYNRTALLEARALLKADIGDRKSDLDVSLPGAAANVESAELGAVGVELGAGLSVPVGAEGGVLFIDGSAELRSGYTNLNGTVGYRINF